MKKIVIMDAEDGYTARGRRDGFNAVAESDIALSFTNKGKYYVMKYRDGKAGAYIDGKDLINLIEDDCDIENENSVDIKIPDPEKLRSICDPIREKKFNKELALIVELIVAKIEARAKEGHSFFKSNGRNSECELNIAFDKCNFIDFADIATVFIEKGYLVDKYSTGTWMISWGDKTLNY